MTLDTGHLSCVFDSGTVGDDHALEIRMHSADPEEKQPSVYGARSSCGLTRRSKLLSSRSINDDSGSWTSNNRNEASTNSHQPTSVDEDRERHEG